MFDVLFRRFQLCILVVTVCAPLLRTKMILNEMLYIQIVELLLESQIVELHLNVLV